MDDSSQTRGIVRCQHSNASVDDDDDDDDDDDNKSINTRQTVMWMAVFAVYLPQH